MARPKLLPIAAVLILAWSAPTLADLWYESYEKAEQAMQSENWAEAIRFLTEALNDKGDPAIRARTYGMNFTSYFPYYKLGVVYYRLGRFDDAAQAFETEIQLGAIAEAETELAELERYRGLIEQTRVDAAAEEQRRIDRIVTDNLAAAAGLEQEGRYEEALSAVDNALAVAPDSAEGRSAKQDLLDALARVDEERRIDVRVTNLVAQGRTQLDAGEFAEAASTFDQSLGLRDDAEARRLLERSRTGLRAQLEQRDRLQAIADGIASARRLETEGDLVGALNRLQPVLVLDPNHEQALELQGRLVQAQTERQAQAQAELTLNQLLSTAKTQMENGEFQQSLTTANRVLALDAGNPSAFEYVSTAYREINRNLLGGGPVRNLPPAIRFFDFREEQSDGTRIERLAGARFRLSGEVTDATVVDLVVRGPSGDLLEDVGITRRNDDENLKIVTRFTVDSTVSNGPSVFTVTATDPEGAVASAEYAVLYAVPWFRTPWPYAGGVAGLAAALILIRRFRRRRKLSRRFNPYVTGAPVLKDELFFGRERLLSHVLQRVHVNSVLLYGERRIGKTSFQHRLKRRLNEMQDDEYVFYPVYTDLQGVVEERFFSTLAEDAFEELGPQLNGLEPSAGLQEGSDYSYRSFVSDIRKIIGELKKKHAKKTARVVLLIDEVDELNTYDPRVNQKLRSLFMKTFAENLVAVVSGVGIKKQWEREGSPWYNFFQEIQVKPFRREDAEKLIRVPIHGMFDLESGVVDGILETTDTRPYLIQKFCAALVNRLHDENRRRITVDDVRAVRAQTEA